MIRVACGACGARFKAREEFAGRRGKCPNCSEPVLVPMPDEDLDDEGSADADEPAASKARARAAAPSPARRPAPVRAASPPEPPPELEDQDDEPEDDGQPSEYEEWQDYFGGDEYYDHSENEIW